MPFQSKAQERWAFSTGQPFAKQWAAMTNQQALPQRVDRQKESQVSAFDQLAAKLANRPGVSNPRALAAAIGRRKYGASTMGKAAAQGMPAKTVAREQPRR